jgi:hypothetical protein
MTVWLTLLRVFLSVALVLNGIGGAIASTRMHADQAATVERSASSKMASTGMPCHEHQLAQAGEGHSVPPSDPAPSGKSPTPDCCKSGICTCACAHAAQVALPAFQAAVPAPDHSLAVNPLALAHAAPALPHPIRPPIG